MLLAGSEANVAFAITRHAVAREDVNCTNVARRNEEIEQGRNLEKSNKSTIANESLRKKRSLGAITSVAFVIKWDARRE
jgi:hypothetical protein